MLLKELFLHNTDKNLNYFQKINFNSFVLPESYSLFVYIYLLCIGKIFNHFQISIISLMTISFYIHLR